MKKITTLLFCCIVLMLQLNAQWAETIIDEGLNKPTGFCTADLDQDGDQDIIASIWGARDVIWYENVNDTWNTVEIDGTLGPVGIITADLDQDGKTDIVAAGHSSNAVVWYQNKGGSPIEWEKQIIGSNLAGAEWVAVGDLDNDNDLDVVATGAQSDNVVWYENDGTSLNWEKDTIGINMDGAAVCYIIDMNGDEIPDVITHAIYGDKICWYKNDGSGQTWEEIIIDDAVMGSSGFDVADIDNDGDIDVLAPASNDNTLTIYENSGDGTNWSSYLVDDNINTPFGAKFADIDNDNDLDIVATTNYNGEVILYTNEGGVSPAGWAKSTLVSELTQTWDIAACDIDNDGDLDLVINQFIDNGKIYCYLNPLVPNSINGSSPIQNVRVYPNPSNGIFSISFNNIENTILKFYDLQGRMFMENLKFKGSEIQFDLSSLTKGIYFVELSNDNYHQTKKLIIE